ncbi:MAG: putative peptidoglycan glycosyltransferase FtsW [Candidatus Aminicenantes bacterium]|nr:putative peptidoglycan glycosyltransferase FtsW [Candidatus Aminicenantes bacterium]
MEMFRRYGFDWTLFLAALILVTIGVIMVFNASSAIATDKLNKPFHFAFNQVGGAAFGFILILILVAVRKPFYESKWVVYGLLGLTYGLLALCLTMPEVAATHRWIIVAGIRFQPSELAKLSLIIFLARVISSSRDRTNDLKVFLPAVFALGGAVLLILIEPDFGTALLTFLIGALLLHIGGLRWKNFFYLGLISIPVFAMFILVAQYRIVRVLEFFTKNKDLQRASYQVAQSKLAVGAGGLFGASFGEGTQKYFLPAPHTDFIFSVIAEELGLIGTLAILGLFAVIVWRGLTISMKATTYVSQLIAAGMTFLLAIQALVNVSVVLGLSPAKGVPLPLVSFGRSSLLCSLLAIGILLHISQRKGEVRGA